MIEKTNAIMIDCDGVIFDNFHRRHFLLDRDPKDWMNYNLAAKKDPVNPYAKSIMEHFFINHAILIVTGRMETDQLKEDTLWSLKKNEVPYNEIFFRPKGNFDDDAEVKKTIYQEQIEPRYNVKFIVEDRSRVVKMWRDLGLVCLQPNFEEY